MFIVKNNQSNLLNAILTTPEELFTDSYSFTEKGHGRIVTRTIDVCPAQKGEFDFPHIKQIAIVTRETADLQGKPFRAKEIVGLITSMDAEHASPKILLQDNIDYWKIENRLHYVQDVTFGEDKCRIRTGNAPLIIATLRNLALSLLRLMDVENVAEACRDFAFQPLKAIQCVGG